MNETKITDPNLFMKLVLVALLKNHPADAPKLMLDYRWEVLELDDGPHNYHVIGNHPIAKRLDFFLERTVIH
ncbi:MAG TPA: hypothetical protein P5509_04990 [Bacteroidales bacterium]|nr:hypothetical protein [Bacteroidales bacterium]